MKSKKVPRFIPWLAVGAVLFSCSYIPFRSNSGIKLRIFGISNFVVAFLWFLLPEFMENHGRKLYGIWLILVGSYLAFNGLLFGGFGVEVRGLDGLVAVVIGIGFLIIT